MSKSSHSCRNYYIMAQIDKLMDNMVAKKIGMAKITSGEPMLLWRGAQQAQGATLPLPKVFEMVREIAPAQKRLQLSNDKCQFKFSYKSPTGYFDVEVMRREKLVVTLSFVAVAHSRIANLSSIESWSPKLLREIDAHRHIVTGVALSPDGTTVGSSSLDGSARLWDAANGSLVRELHPAFKVEDKKALHPRGKYSIAFSHDGELIAVGGSSVTVTARGGFQCYSMMLGLYQAVNSISFSPDNRILAGASSFVEPPKNETEEMAMAVLEVVSIFVPNADSNGGPVKPDTTGKLGFVDLSTSRKPRLCNLWSDTGLKRFGAEITTVNFMGMNTNLIGAGEDVTHPRATCTIYSPDNKTLACSDNTGKINFFDTTAKSSIWNSLLAPQTKVDLGIPILSIEYDSEGHHLLILTNSDVRYFDVRARRTLWNYPCLASAARLIGKHGVALSLEREKCIELLSLKGTHSNLDSLKLPATGTSLSISNDGKILACGDTHGNVSLWRLSH